ncbi:hypothetical protein U9M48_039082 [Paspalum notatum var. saurae]|uniref:Transposase n=1 Tax=Paspalum notatum var. saurae TaxID=547442 RepID=A0AAQ3UPI3_PASNO
MDMEDYTKIETDSEEEEDEMMMLIFPALYYASTRSKTPCHTSKLSGAEYTCELLEGHERRSYENLRMEPRIFKALADYLSSRDLLRSTRGVTVEEQLAMFMYMLARNASYRALCDRFQHSGETIHRHITACFNAISSLAFDFVKPPSTETHWKISSNPHFAPYFQNCLGAIDGTHIPITISERWEGSASDAGVLSSAIRSGFRVPTGKYYLVDGGYANTPSFLSPYRSVRYHLKDQGRGNCRPRDYKELFNLRHARLRNHIERAIGILKMRFPILKVATYYPMETQVKIPAAAVVIHNIIRRHKGDDEWLSSQEPLIDPSKFVSLPEDEDNERYRDDSSQMSLMAQAQRAKWTTKYEKGLVDILTEYKGTHYRGQNGWCTEGWNRIVKDFNNRFPELNFSKGKIQDKEAQLKKEYKAIKSIRNRSGVSWNQEASMINTSTEVWDEIIQEDSKLRRYEKKSFPLFDSLDLLYEGQLAEGKHLFTSSKPHSTSKGPEARGIDKVLVDFSKKNPWTGPINITARPSTSDGERLDSPLRLGDSLAHAKLPKSKLQLLPVKEVYNSFPLDMTKEAHEVEKQSSHQQVDNGNAQAKKRSSHELLENLGRPSSYGKPIDLSDNDEAEEEHDASSRSVTIGSSRGRSKRRNDAKTVPRIEETMCLNVLKDMADLTDDVKILASEVFKDAINREIFLGYEPRLRGLWLSKEVKKIAFESTGS